MNLSQKSSRKVYWFATIKNPENRSWQSSIEFNLYCISWISRLTNNKLLLSCLCNALSMAPLKMLSHKHLKASRKVLTQAARLVEVLGEVQSEKSVKTRGLNWLWTWCRTLSVQDQLPWIFHKLLICCVRLSSLSVSAGKSEKEEEEGEDKEVGGGKLIDTSLPLAPLTSRRCCGVGTRRVYI